MDTGIATLAVVGILATAWVIIRKLRGPLPKCRVYEYDGAFKCYTHDRKWGAIENPDAPCEQWLADGKPMGRQD